MFTSYATDFEFEKEVAAIEFEWEPVWLEGGIGVFRGDGGLWGDSSSFGGGPSSTSSTATFGTAMATLTLKRERISRELGRESR